MNNATRAWLLALTVAAGWGCATRPDIGSAAWWAERNAAHSRPGA